MNDIEDLLRETLHDQRRRLDPPPGLYAAVQAQARTRRHTRWTAGLAAAAVVAIAAAGIAIGRPGDRHSNVSTTTPTAAPTSTAAPAPTSLAGTLGGDLALAKGSPATVASLPGASWAVYTDSSTSPATGSLVPVAGWASKAAPEPVPPGNNVGMAVDPEVPVLWVWTNEGDTSNVRSYDNMTDKPTADYSVASEQIFGGAAVGGDLWLATNSGLWRVDSVTGSASKIAAVSGLTYGIAADQARDRILVGVSAAESSTFVGTRVEAVDASSGAVTATGTPMSIGKESIAVVNGEVWVAGYGDVDQQRVIHLDATTLDPAGTSPVNAKVGPGSQVWAGQHVVWIRDGGDEQLACIDPSDGAILEEWPQDVQGPVTSAAGQAYAANNGSLQKLNLTGSCTG